MFSGTLTLSSSMEVLYRTDSSPAKVCRGTRMAGKTKISCADKRLHEYRKKQPSKVSEFQTTDRRRRYTEHIERIAREINTNINRNWSRH